MPLIDSTGLHAAIGHPSLDATAFLNEIMKRHPDALSFAPGAPHLVRPSASELAGHTARWLDHMRTSRNLTDDQAERLLQEYGPSRGLINDLVATALHRDHGLPDRPEAVVVTAGAQEAMLLTLRALHRDGDDLVAVTSPCYVGLLGAARMLDLDTVPIPDTGAGPDLHRLRRACHRARAAGRRIRSLYVAPDHANPSGTVMPLATRHALLQLASEEDLFVLEDAAYGFTAAPGAELPPLKALDRDTRVVHLGTFAKVCLPGARVGYVVADQPVRTPDRPDRLLADELAALKGVVTVNTSPLGQSVVGGMLLAHGGSLAELGRAGAEVYRGNMRALLHALDTHLGSHPRLRYRARWNRPTGGFFVRVRLPVPADAALLDLSATRHRVLWTPMSAFGIDPDDGTSHELRLSSSYLNVAQIDEGIRRLAGMIAELPQPTEPLPEPGTPLPSTRRHDLLERTPSR